MKNGKPHGTFQVFDYTKDGYSTIVDYTGEFEHGFLTKNSIKGFGMGVRVNLIRNIFMNILSLIMV